MSIKATLMDTNDEEQETEFISRGRVASWGHLITKKEAMKTPHVVAEPHILYLGTPVALVSTVNEDDTHNLAPISSVFWLGWRGVLECPIQLEAVVAAVHGIGEDNDQLRGFISLIEVRIQRVHVHPDLLVEGHANRIDPDKWSPLIMSFQKFYGLSAQVHPSRLADIPEESYAPPARA